MYDFLIMRDDILYHNMVWKTNYNLMADFTVIWHLSGAVYIFDSPSPLGSHFLF